MKKLLILLFLPFLLAARGGNVKTSANAHADCSAVTGACPQDNYVCIQTSDNHIYKCDSPNTWTDLTALVEGMASTDINTSAKLAAIVTDETGTGLLVFGTSPTVLTGLTLSDGTDADFCITVNQGTGTDPRICWDDSEARWEFDTDGTIGDGEDTTISGSSVITPPSATPTSEYTDDDTTDEDPSTSIVTNCTDTATTTEDCDMTFSQQIAGSMTAFITADADAVTAFNLNIGAAPPATCTAGAIYIDTDESTDTNCTTTSDNSLCLCIATDTWVELDNN